MNDCLRLEKKMAELSQKLSKEKNRNKILEEEKKDLQTRVTEQLQALEEKEFEKKQIREKCFNLQESLMGRVQKQQ